MTETDVGEKLKGNLADMAGKVFDELDKTMEKCIEDGNLHGPSYLQIAAAYLAAQLLSAKIQILGEKFGVKVDAMFPNGVPSSLEDVRGMMIQVKDEPRPEERN